MKKKLLWTISFCLLAAALLSTAVLAAVEANQYIWKTTVSIGVDDYGVVTVASGVTATDIAKVSFYAGQMGVAGGSHTTNSAIVP